MGRIKLMVMMVVFGNRRIVLIWVDVQFFVFSFKLVFVRLNREKS